MRKTLESHFVYKDGDNCMKVLVIPDIHLKTWIFDRAEDILKSAMIVIDTETGKYKKIDVLGA